MRTCARGSRGLAASGWLDTTGAALAAARGSRGATGSPVAAGELCGTGIEDEGDTCTCDEFGMS